MSARRFVLGGMAAAVLVVGCAGGSGSPSVADRNAVTTAAAASTTGGTPTSPPPDPGALNGLLGTGSADWQPVATPEELARYADVVLIGTVEDVTTAEGVSLVRVRSEPGSDGRGHFATGDPVGMALNAYSIEDEFTVEDVAAALPAGSRIVLYGRLPDPRPATHPVVQDLASRAGVTVTVQPALPQTLAVQLPGDPAIHWPGLDGAVDGDLRDTLPGGTLVGPPMDTTSLVDRRWELATLRRSQGQGYVETPLGGLPTAWWSVSGGGRLVYDAGCGPGTADVVPVVTGFRVLRVVEPAPDCVGSDAAAEVRSAFADTFEVSAFLVFPTWMTGEPLWLTGERSLYGLSVVPA